MRILVTLTKLALARELQEMFNPYIHVSDSESFMRRCYVLKEGSGLVWNHYLYNIVTLS